MTTSTRPELRDVLDVKGNKRYADAGATRQGGNHAIKECSLCGSYVVFVQSTKTGKWYLANCSRYTNRDAYYYVKASPHFTTCETTQAQKAANIAAQDLRTLRQTKTAEMLATTEQIKHLGLADDEWEAEFNARFDAVERKYADEIARLQAIIDAPRNREGAK